MPLTKIEAQDRYISRVNDPNRHPGHFKRVQRSAAHQLHLWAIDRGYTYKEAIYIVEEARQVAKLQRNAED